MVQILQHVVLSERVLLRGLPPPGDLIPAAVHVRHRLGYAVVMMILRCRFPVGVPDPAMVPDGAWSLAQVHTEWTVNMRWLRDYVRHLGNKAGPAVFRHPVAGPLTIDQILAMAGLHLRYHAPQIDRILRSATPPAGDGNTVNAHH